MLLSYSEKTKGEYKSEDNLILKEENSIKNVIFRPVSASQTKQAMEQLILAYKEAYQDSEINRLLLIPCFILDFLAIHPFDDGNGRMSRLLTLLLLYKENYDIGKYISYEKMIDEYRLNYYEELRKSQLNWFENKNDYSYFIVFHFQILYKCYQELSKKFIDENTIKKPKKERIKDVINNSVIPLSKKQIQDILPDISINTIEKTIKEMLKENKIKKIGTYKDARYKVID